MDKTQDLVSIITPCFNCAEFIGQMIESVLAQTYRNWELLLVDDCSTDGTEKVIAPYLEMDSRILYHRNESNSGAAVSRNWALQRARGRWIAFLDGDDHWYPEKLKRQISFMEERDVHFSYTKYVEMDESGKEIGVEVSGPSRITKQGMYAFCWPGCLTVMFDKSVIGVIRIANIKKNNDYAMWLKVCHKADCYLLNEVLAKYRRGRKGSISTQGYGTLIRWHYLLFRKSEKMGVLSSAWHTGINLICGVYKKIRFVNRYEVSN